MLQTTIAICSRPAEVAEQCVAERQLEPLVRVALTLVLGCTAAFGLVLGGARDFTQAFSTALKLPLVWVVTLAICAPAFHALSAVLGRGIGLRGVGALILVASARASLLLFALLPLLWLFTDLTRDAANQYHQVTFVAALAYGVSGLLALGVLLRAFPRSLRSAVTLAGCGFVFFMVCGQTAWSLRPFVGRPAERESPWFRAPEGTFVEALWVGMDSARGVYRRDAPEPLSNRFPSGNEDLD
jgi:hypothetical protein